MRHIWTLFLGLSIAIQIEVVEANAQKPYFISINCTNPLELLPFLSHGPWKKPLVFLAILASLGYHLVTQLEAIEKEH